ncbi:LytTR family transcriptional regulator [Lutimaribacter sp. EGI FJ00015]|uniref:LytTR family transcriptional regulator n=1 Tax=Lutimaribacter degradans TaxID=2945989 RepID=A0ACC5ZQL6_9RHOB|nr:LytTR family DNA-binding domain-containing protein [Lutimaribacter sp. EGI FJ00013]MCM2560602.1 LytTR family transcriptional regulator [Lutimaribacter sp. EGI FJ00013]MCO0612455.1 LytTR family transcriptional regulator [Lutimaribacter sp. EGI FJ00015]MCO0634426.1 LytTR family transcriptional regulator [Lutimaribacter sp. EGI FJ00014]
MNLPTRFACWTLMVFGTTFMAYVARAQIARHVDGQKRPFLYEACAVGLMVFYATPFVMLLAWGFGGMRCVGIGCVARFAFYVASGCATVFLMRRVIPGFEDMVFFSRDEDGAVQLVAPAPVTPAQLEEPPRPRLYRRLEGQDIGEVLHLTASGHFVTVTGDRATHKIRMRFADAVNEMDPVDGLCTHRSHWVARAAVSDHRRASGKLFIVLKNGMEVPVSRTYRPGLEKAGLIPHSGA